MGLRCACPSLILFAIVVNSSHSNAAGLRSGTDRRELTFCASDVSFCPDGHTQTRDPSNNCEFRPLCDDAADAKIMEIIERSEETTSEAGKVLTEAETVLKRVGLTRYENPGKHPNLPGKNPNLRGKSAEDNTEAVEAYRSSQPIPVGRSSSAEIWGVETELAEATSSPTQAPIEDVNDEEILRAIEKADKLITALDEEMEKREQGQSEINETEPPPKDPNTTPGADMQSVVVGKHEHVEGHLKGHLASEEESGATTEDVPEAAQEREGVLIKEGTGASPISDLKARLKADLDKNAMVEAEMKEKLETLLRNKQAAAKKKRTAREKRAKRKKKAQLAAKGRTGN